MPTIVIPYRGDAKQRLPASIRAAVAVAMLGDVVSAALEVGKVFVVTDVSHDRELIRREHVGEAAGEAGAPAAARQENDLHAGTARSERVRGPKSSA